jgi:hypothetical protein
MMHWIVVGLAIAFGMALWRPFIVVISFLLPFAIAFALWFGAMSLIHAAFP